MASPSEPVARHDFQASRAVRFGARGEGAAVEADGARPARAGAELDADFAARYEQDFAKAFRGDLAPIEKLVVDVLQPYGGLFWDGHYDLAPDDWKNFGST